VNTLKNQMQASTFKRGIVLPSLVFTILSISQKRSHRRCPEEVRAAFGIIFGIEKQDIYRHHS
jgi:hypothetical protein